MDQVSSNQYGVDSGVRLLGNFQQGEVVYFNPPYANSKFLAEQQLGVVLSTNGYNGSGAEQGFVCPLFPSAPNVQNSFADSGSAITIKSKQGKVLVFRPDLMSVVAFQELTTCIPPNGYPIIVPEHIVKQVVKGFIDIIGFTQKKMDERTNNGLIGYGQVGWCDRFPQRDNSKFTDRSPVLCLSPMEHRDGGLALFIRSRTRFERYHPRMDIEVTLRGFESNFFSPASLQILSTTNIFGEQNIGFVSFGEESLGRLVRKMSGFFDQKAYAAIVAENLGPVGELPGNIKEALQRPHGGNHGHRARHYGR